MLEGRWFRIWFHPIDLQLPFGNGRCSNQSNMAVPVPYSFPRWNSIFVPVQTPLQQVRSTGLYSTDRDKIAKLSHGDLIRKSYMQLVQLSCSFFSGLFHTLQSGTCLIEITTTLLQVDFKTCRPDMQILSYLSFRCCCCCCCCKAKIFSFFPLQMFLTERIKVNKNSVLEKNMMLPQTNKPSGVNKNHTS